MVCVCSLTLGFPLGSHRLPSILKGCMKELPGFQSLQGCHPLASCSATSQRCKGTEEEFRCLNVTCSNVVTKLCSPSVCQLHLPIKGYVGAGPGPLRVNSEFRCHTDLSLFLWFLFPCLHPNRQLVLYSDTLDARLLEWEKKTAGEPFSLAFDLQNPAGAFEETWKR